jgi:hypothetical protein
MSYFFQNSRIIRVVRKDVAFDFFEKGAGTRESGVNIDPKSHGGESDAFDGARRLFEPDYLLLQNVPRTNFNRMKRFEVRTNFELARKFAVAGTGGEYIIEGVLGGGEFIDSDLLAIGITHDNIRVIGS